MERNSKRLEKVARFLETETTLALATVSKEGLSRVTPLFYLPQDGLRLFWFSSSASAHSRNLKRNPRSAVTVFRCTADWKEIRGVQMMGAVSVVSDAALRRAIAKTYTTRFHLGKVFVAAISASTLYCFQPDWLRYIDNSRRFRYKFELSLPPA
jgi:uncharacterized protein YhbP (UPF0306 family)